MKIIFLKSGTVTDSSGKEHDISTRDLIEASLNNPPKTGFTFAEMKKRERIDDALAIANGKLELEDADFDTLKECIGQMQWAGRSKFLINFISQFEN